MDRIRTLIWLERGARLTRRAGLGRLVDGARGRLLQGLGTFTAELEGIQLSGDTAAHSTYIREILAEGREGYMLSLWQQSIHPGMVVLDVGAYLGLLTLMAARAGATAFAFEPNPKTLPYLRRNLAQNNLGNRVTVVEAAAAEDRGSRTFFLDHGGDTSSLHRHDGSIEHVEIATVRADDIIGDRVVDVMKIDVEGAELEVLAGLEHTIASSPNLQLFIECNPTALAAAGHSDEQLVDRLVSWGMTVETIDEQSHTLVPFRRVDPGTYVNLLARKTAPTT